MKCEPLKEPQLRELAKCAQCGRLVGQTGVPIIWKVTVERHFLDLPAISRQHGLGMMLGSGTLAQVMGQNEDMTRPMMERKTLGICDDCATRELVLAPLVED